MDEKVERLKADSKRRTSRRKKITAAQRQEAWDKMSDERQYRLWDKESARIERHKELNQRGAKPGNIDSFEGGSWVPNDPCCWTE